MRVGERRCEMENIGISEECASPKRGKWINSALPPRSGKPNRTEFHAKLGITFTAILPRLTPHTDLGRPAVEAYAARNGQSVDDYVQSLGEPLTPEAAGSAVVELVGADAATLAPSYLLTGAGLRQLD